MFIHFTFLSILFLHVFVGFLSILVLWTCHSKVRVRAVRVRGPLPRNGKMLPGLVFWVNTVHIVPN